VVVDPTLNAFAGPAGYIYFHTGLILAAGSLDELAGVMAHEIAHAKRSHVARSIEKATVPDLLAKLLGVGVAVAADEPGALIAAEGVSQSLQLAYTRELEAEADEVGVAFLVRAGYEPMGMATFFERLAAERQPDLGFEIPHLQSHPRVESRLDAAVQRARNTTVSGALDPRLAPSFPELQVRLARVIDSGRTTLPARHPAPNPQCQRRGAHMAAERQAAGGQSTSRRDARRRRARRSPTTRARARSGAANGRVRAGSPPGGYRRAAARARARSRGGAHLISRSAVSINEPFRATASTRSSISSRPSAASSPARPASCGASA
jgi:hypothetical protein